MQFFAVRRAEIVDVTVLLRRKADRVDDQRVAILIMADGFAEPGQLHIGRMFVGEEDSPHHVVALPDQPYLFRRLNRIEGLEGIKQLARNAAWPATRLSREGDLSLAAEHFLIGGLDLSRRPWLQNGVLGVGNADRDLLVRPVAIRVVHKGIGRILPYRTVAGAGRWVLPILFILLPAEIYRREIGNRIFRRRLRGCHRDRSGGKQARKQPAQNRAMPQFRSIHCKPRHLHLLHMTAGRSGRALGRNSSSGRTKNQLIAYRTLTDSSVAPFSGSDIDRKPLDASRT